MTGRGHNIEPRTQRCRRLGHRWVEIDTEYVCVRRGCEAWYSPEAPTTEQLITYEFIDEVTGRWLPADPIPRPWGNRPA